jgi:hypothetical protein
MTKNQNLIFRDQKMISGRELFNKFLKGEPLERPPFVPLIRGLTARVEGVPQEAIHSDPALWANSLSKTTELFNFDGLVAGFDFSLMAEACGCRIKWENDHPVLVAPPDQLCQNPEKTGRMKNALEAADRVFQVCRARRACVVALTGPVTLAHQLFGREAGKDHFNEVKQLVVQVTEAFCRIRPDVLVFMEGRPLALTRLNIAHRRLYQTLKNITAYYNISDALYLQGYRPEDLGTFAALNMDIYILGPSETGGFPPLEALWELGDQSRGIGIGLPLSDMARVREIIQQGMDWYRAKGQRRFFFTSFGPMTRDISLETLQQLIREINEVRF